MEDSLRWLHRGGLKRWSKASFIHRPLMSDSIMSRWNNLPKLFFFFFLVADVSKQVLKYPYLRIHILLTNCTYWNMYFCTFFVHMDDFLVQRKALIYWVSKNKVDKDLLIRSGSLPKCHTPTKPKHLMNHVLGSSKRVKCGHCSVCLYDPGYLYLSRSHSHVLLTVGVLFLLNVAYEST